MENILSRQRRGCSGLYTLFTLCLEISVKSAPCVNSTGEIRLRSLKQTSAHQGIPSDGPEKCYSVRWVRRFIPMPFAIQIRLHDIEHDKINKRNRHRCSEDGVALVDFGGKDHCFAFVSADPFS